MTSINNLLRDTNAWLDFVGYRKDHLRQFLLWAETCEANAPETSLRFEHRSDMNRCREALHLFDEPWWAVVVYSCFDSLTGTRVAVSTFRSPVPPRGQHAIARLFFPQGSVQHHRAQAGLTRAKQALVFACNNRDDLEDILCAGGTSFDERFDELRRLNVRGWGRTTYFDVLARAGVLAVGEDSYRPDRAYLLGSTGPKKGFESIWGIQVDGVSGEACEQLLRLWTRDWDLIADMVGVKWPWEPYDSADFENALCIFQERRR